MTLRASNCERRGAGMAWKPSPQAEGHGTRQRHLLRRPRLRDATLAAPIVDARPERGRACPAAGKSHEIEGALRLRFRCGRRRGGEVGQARVRGGARRAPERRHARCQSAQCGLQRRCRRLLALRFRFRRRRSGEVRQARVRFRVLRTPERRHGRHSRGRCRTATARSPLVPRGRRRQRHVVISGQVNCCCFLLIHYRRGRSGDARSSAAYLVGVAAHRTSDAGTVRLSRIATEVSEVQNRVVRSRAVVYASWMPPLPGEQAAVAECQRYARSSASAA